MRTKTSVLVVVCGVAALTSFTTHPSAQSSANIVMETSFENCADWNQSLGLGDKEVCGPTDGIAGWGGWTTSAGNGDTITAAANNPAGKGGKGFRSMVGPGTNNSGGGFRFEWGYELRELWVRFYMRHQAGFRWEFDSPHYEKNLYFNDTIANAPVFVFGYGNGYWGVHKVNPGSDHLTDPTKTGHWRDIEGTTGDGLFHYYEVHVKMDTNGSNGIAESWVDGRLVASFRNVNWNGSIGYPGWRFFSGAINQNVVKNTTDMYVDYDDLALSTTGYIGPVGGGGSSSSGTIPSAPVNLRIVP